MKKPITYMLLVVGGVIAGLIIAGLIITAMGYSIFDRTNNIPALSAKADNAELTALAFSVAEDIKEGDFLSLSQIAHPEYGVVFSPYATVMLSTDKCFQAEQIAAFKDDNKLYVWGLYNGSGEPIELTVADYFNEFVFNRDYTSASVIGINRIVRSGNALENLTDIFPDVQFVDFYIPGGEKDSAEDCTWNSMRLGFEEYEGSLRLTVILHSEWAE